MNVSFTEKQEKYIAAQLSSGDYLNASEVVREALRLHELYRSKVLEELRAEIAKGWDGATSKRSVEDIVRARTKVYKPE
ncbi:MAG: type II toxin-antitoxin system ParD family antitoxin [Prolixibacteraceae bacterium]|nr:type II toxin-antitoxin system ParD family antitoxin [Prolixibacteraceae bacterium]